MSQTLHSIRETAIIGKSTRELLISGANAPILPALHIRLAGISLAAPGFSWVRHHPDSSQVLACVKGEGQVWVDGVWAKCGAGQAYLTSANRPHAYRAVRGVWKLAWVTYGLATLGASCHEPRLIPFPSEALDRALAGLHAEASWGGATGLVEQWARLMDGYVRSGLSTGNAPRPRLLKVWHAVEANVAHPWSIPQLMRLAGMSETHLRRVAIAETGRSPMRQVAHLRMLHARTLLLSGVPVKATAAAVGYENEFAFSTAFRREMQQAPSTLR